jgi:hypothetical protein
LVKGSTKLAARVGLAPTPCDVTNRRTTLIPPGNKKDSGRLTERRSWGDATPHTLGNDIAVRTAKLVAGVGVAPTEAELMRPA